MLWHQKEQTSLLLYWHQWTPPLALHSTWVSGLADLRRAFPKDWKFDSLSTVESQCVFPFFSPFITPSTRKDQFLWIENRPAGSGPPVMLPYRIPGSDFDCTRFRVCPCCAGQDLAKYGEPYLHRHHHLPGINLCLEHNLPLVKVTRGIAATASKVKKAIEMIATRDVAPSAPSAHPLVRALDSSVKHVLRRPIQLDDNLDFSPLYRVRLFQLGYSNSEIASKFPIALRKAYRGVPDNLARLSHRAGGNTPAGGTLPALLSAVRPGSAQRVWGSLLDPLTSDRGFGLLPDP